MFFFCLYTSVQFSRSVMSNSLWPHGLQHAGLPCPLLSPRVCSISCPLSQWGNPTISSSVISFSPCPQSLPASGSFPVSRLFASGGQNIGASVSASVLPMNIQGWFPLGLTSLILWKLKIKLVFLLPHTSITPVLQTRRLDPERLNNVSEIK